MGTAAHPGEPPSAAGPSWHGRLPRRLGPLGTGGPTPFGPGEAPLTHGQFCAKLAKDAKGRVTPPMKSAIFAIVGVVGCNFDAAGALDFLDGGGTGHTGRGKPDVISPPPDAGVDALPGVDVLPGVDALPDAEVDALPDAGVDALPDGDPPPDAGTDFTPPDIKPELPPGNVCVVLPQSGCPTGYTCRVASGTCVTYCSVVGPGMQGAVCSSEWHCASGFQCSRGQCQRICATTKDCDAGLTCQSVPCNINGYHRLCT